MEGRGLRMKRPSNGFGHLGRGLSASRAGEALRASEVIHPKFVTVCFSGGGGADFQKNPDPLDDGKRKDRPHFLFSQILNGSKSCSLFENKGVAQLKKRAETSSIRAVNR